MPVCPTCACLPALPPPSSLHSPRSLCMFSQSIVGPLQSSTDLALQTGAVRCRISSLSSGQNHPYWYNNKVELSNVFETHRLAPGHDLCLVFGSFLSAHKVTLCADAKDKETMKGNLQLSCCSPKFGLNPHFGNSFLINPSKAWKIYVCMKCQDPNTPSYMVHLILKRCL